MRKIALGLLCCFVLGLSVPSHGQWRRRGRKSKLKKSKKSAKKSGKKGAKGKQDEPPPRPLSAFEALGVQLPLLARPSGEAMKFRAQMTEWLRLSKKGKHSQADQVLKRLDKLRWDLGYSNVISMSTALLKAGERAREAGDSARALKLFRRASEFSPALSEPHYRYGWLLLRTNPAKVYKATKSLLRGVQKQRRDMYGIAVFLTNLLRFFAWIFGVAFLLFWIVLMLRSLRSFQSDFRDLFPDGVTAFQIQLLSLFLIFLPLLMGAGILETLLLWIAISWFYQTTGERVLTTVGLVLLSVAPYAADWAGRMVSLSGSKVEALYMLNETELGARHIPSLEAQARRNKDPYLLWSLGLHFKRKGSLETARMYYKRAYKRKKDPRIQINLANLDFIEQKAESAYNIYRRALRRSGVAEGQYNLSLIFQHSSSTDVVPQKVHALTAARANGGERIEQFMERSAKHINRYVMDVKIPRQLYLKGLFALPDRTGLKARLWSYAATWIPLDLAPWIGGLMALLLWILFPVGRRFFCGEPCPKCGRIISRKEQQGGEQSHCTQCLQLEGKTSDGISPERRVRKEIEIQRFRKLRARVLTSFAVVCMGAGQLLLRESTKAFLFFVLLASVAFVWLFQPPLLVHPYALGSGPSFWGAVLLSVLALLFYIRSVRAVLDER